MQAAMQALTRLREGIGCLHGLDRSDVRAHGILPLRTCARGAVYLNFSMWHFPHVCVEME